MHRNHHTRFRNIRALLAAVTIGSVSDIAIADDFCPDGTVRHEITRPDPSIFCKDANGKSQGPAVVYRTSGAKKSEGTNRDGQRHGWWKYWDAEGVLQADDEYREGKKIARHRVGVEATEIRRSRPEDPVHPCPDNAVVAGSPTNPQREQWCERDRGQGAYVLHGPRLSWDPDGRLSKREEFRDGVPHGEWIEWRDGRKESHWTYAYGKYDGVYRAWYENGKLSHVSEYDRGVERRSSNWYENGSPRDEVVSDEKGETVRRTFWYENGVKRHEEDWSGGKRTGIEREWWSNGKPKSEIAKRDGRQVGALSRWNFEGQLIERSSQAADGSWNHESFAVTVYDEPDWMPRPIARPPGSAPKNPVVCPEGARLASSDLDVDVATLLESMGDEPGRIDRFHPLAWIDVTIGVWQVCTDVRDGTIIDGPAAMFDRAGQLVGTGAIVGNRKAGKWISWGPEGERLQETDWWDGEKKRVISWMASGGMHSIRHYEGGKEHGLFATWHDTGSRMVVGGMDAGEYDGPWVWYDKSGFRYKQGGYQRGKEHGEWTEWHQDGSIESVTNYDQGKRHGAYRHAHQGGVPDEEGTYERGQKHGQWTEWRASEKWKVVHYQNGERHGPYLRWEKGRLEEQGQFERGRRVGTWTMHHQNGQRREEGPYVWCEHPPTRRVFFGLPGGSVVNTGSEQGCRQGQWTYFGEDGRARDTFVHQEAANAAPPASPGGRGATIERIDPPRQTAND